MVGMGTYRGTNVIESLSDFNFLFSAFDRTTWLYDQPTGLLTNKVYADGKGPSYTYTPQGQLATRTWARGVVTTYNYTNTTGELIGIDYSDATPDVAFAYDRLGRHAGVTDAQGSQTYGYDPFTLAVSHETIMAGGVTSVIARTYDTQGRAIGLTFDDDYAAGYGFDALGRFCRLSSVIGGSSSNTWQYSYLPDSGLISGWSNGILSTVKSYEAHRNLLTGVQNLANGVAISTYRYSNDVLGRRTQRIDTTASAMTNAFDYNIRSELTNAVMGAHSFGWAFDAIGNRQTHTANGTNRTYLANALNQYTNITAGTVQVPQYDLDGNLIFLPSTSGEGAGGEGWYLQWNGENRLQGASNGSTIVAFQYDHMGRRLSKSVNGVTNLFYYDGWNVIAEKSAGAFTCHIWGPDLSGSMQGAGGIGGLLATHASGNLYFACADGNGNVTEYTDATGTNVVARYRYGAYGELLEVSGVKASDFHILFSSKYLDRETAVPGCPGWYYYGYRYLSDGRWMSRDPIGENGGVSLYTGCGNNNINSVDPTGHSKMFCSDAISAFDKNYQLWAEFKDRAKKIKDADCKLSFGCGSCLPTIGEAVFSPPKHIQITLCHKYCQRKEWSDWLGTLRHEFSHAYDLCQNGGGFPCNDSTGKINPRRICTEIRAYLKDVTPTPTKQNVITSACKSYVGPCLISGGMKEEDLTAACEGLALKIYDVCSSLKEFDPIPVIYPAVLP